jgi:hypothetical protein
MTDVVETAFYIAFKNPLRRIAFRQKFETLFAVGFWDIHPP